MAHSVSAKKRIRQNAKRRLYNKSIMSEIRTRSKRLAQAVEANDTERAREVLGVVISRIGKARKNKVIHRNMAARMESRLTRLANSVLRPEETA